MKPEQCPRAWSGAHKRGNGAFQVTGALANTLDFSMSSTMLVLCKPMCTARDGTSPKTLLTTVKQAAPGLIKISFPGEIVEVRKVPELETSLHLVSTDVRAHQETVWALSAPWSIHAKVITDYGVVRQGRELPVGQRIVNPPLATRASIAQGEHANTRITSMSAPRLDGIAQGALILLKIKVANDDIP